MVTQREDSGRASGIRGRLGELCYSSGLLHSLQWMRGWWQKDLRILAYHRVMPLPDPRIYDFDLELISTPPERFREQCDVRVGHNWARAEFPSDSLPVHKLFLDEDGITFDLTFTNEVPTWMPGGGRTTYGDRDYFAWCVGAPRARVSGTVTIHGETIEADGIGYHDHNWGVGDMKRIIDHWYWGRLYTDDLTVIYANVHTTKKYGSHSSMPLMVARGSEVLVSTGEVTSLEGPRVFNEVANRDYPSTLSLQSDEVDLTFDVQRIVHANDFLEMVPVVRSRFVKPLVNKLLGRPGYFRFESDFDLTVRLEDEVLKETGRTMHEMVALT